MVRRSFEVKPLYGVESFLAGVREPFSNGGMGPFWTYGTFLNGVRE